MPDADRPDRPAREAFPIRFAMPTRWRDDDAYGHMNNVVYYEYFDSAVNRWLIGSGALDWPDGPVRGLVVETSCRFFAPVGFPQTLEIGLGLERAGRTSVTYRLALWGRAAEAAAVCRYVHVYVDAASGRPAPLTGRMRAALARLGP